MAVLADLRKEHGCHAITADVDLAACRAASDLCGSGATPDDVAAIFRHADAAIVYSRFERDGQWFDLPAPARARDLVNAARSAMG